MRIFLLLFLLIKSLESTPQSKHLVRTSKGVIQGLAADDGDYTMFLGVPFAVVDEDNPFGDASPHPGFKSTFKATTDPVICPQNFGAGPLGDINCMNLNIYVPNSANTTNKLPVMFFIPGGGFVTGNGNRYDLGPKFLVKHDVILITINYRLGPYGFLCVDVPGYNNQGLKDQILALEWVRDNIESFGGDVDRITAFGQSAGAMSVDIHLLINKGYFKRVIIQSGPVLSPWVISSINNNIPIDIANALGFDTKDVTEALNYLKQANVADVIQVASDIRITADSDGHPLTKPCVEVTGNALITEYPINLKPKVEDIEIMIGHSFREVSFIYPDINEEYYNNYKFGDELIKEFDEVLDENDFKHFYIGDEAPSMAVKHEILDFGSDFAFAHPTERTVARYIEEKAKKIYRYMFTYEGDRNILRIIQNLTSDGASHGDEMGYLWNIIDLTETPSEEDQKVIDIMTKMWTDFAKYGDPTPTAPNELIPVKWREVSGDERPYLRIDNPLTLENRPFRERMAFWDVYYKLHGDRIRGLRR